MYPSDSTKFTYPKFILGISDWKIINNMWAHQINTRNFLGKLIDCYYTDSGKY
jgi:hypothetical protein